MNPWIIYIRERFFLPTLAFLVTGISLSGIFLNNNSFSLTPFLLSFTGIFLFFILQRLMDDVQNLERDRIAYPERPLPRGVIKIPTAKNMVDRLQIILFAYSMILWVILQETAGLTYLTVAMYSWLIYRNFFIGAWLHRHPIVHRVFLQLFIFPVVFFAVSAAHPNAVFLSETWAFALMLFGAFSCYEICLKLDPHAHPVTGGFVHFYGFHRTFEIATLALVISAMAATTLNLSLILLPSELLVLIALALLFFHPQWFKIPETVAAISLMLHAWAIVLFQWNLN